MYCSQVYTCIINNSSYHRRTLVPTFNLVYDTCDPHQSNTPLTYSHECYCFHITSTICQYPFIHLSGQETHWESTVYSVPHQKTWLKKSSQDSRQNYLQKYRMPICCQGRIMLQNQQGHKLLFRILSNF